LTSPLLGAPDADFRSGAETPSQRLAAHLDRIDRRESEVRAFVHLETEAAIAAAAASSERWLRGEPLSALDGTVIGVKDVIETGDMPTGQGSPIWAGFRSNRDAAAVQALRQAGAIILGKTTTTEFAATHVFAGTTNPHDAARTPGGSSSGSAAAIGAGFVRGALGTQVVGSVLRPSSYCGAVGFKPSFGALNRGGSYDQLSQSCIGTLGTTLDDAWAIAGTIAARVGGDPGHRALKGGDALPAAKAPRRLARLDTAGWDIAEPAAKAAFQAELELWQSRGVEIVRRAYRPDLDALENDLAEALALTQRILAWEFVWPMGSYRRDGLSETMAKRLDVARDMTVADYEAALDRRAAIRARFAEIAAGVDGFIALAATGPAPLGHASTGNPAMNVPASLLGTPALSLPLLNVDGLPLGLQLIGKAGGDAELMALARWRLEF